VTELKTSSSKSWSPQLAMALAFFSLLLGVCGGWIIRRSLAAAVPQAVQVSPAERNARQPVGGQPAAPVGSGAVLANPSAQQLKLAADSQAGPLLAELRSQPTNAALLTKLGNLYYDAEQYPIAIEYYQRSLALQPADASVRTDLGTAFWYQGDADDAIGELQKALSYEPNKANTLFNLGIVKWKGKHDAAGAIAEWQKLLATNPRFDNRSRVEELLAEAKASSELKR
jgi:tetratricopeptide (TPR) repeat protein